jgi:hypothetical protein
MRNAHLLALLALVSFVGCEKAKESVDNASPRPPARFEDAMIDKIVPLPNGDAYMVALVDRGVWLLRKDEAVRVKEVPSFAADNKPGRLRPFSYQEEPSQ